MSTQVLKNNLEKLITAVISVLKWIGSFFLALMMFLTASDVVCRYIFNNPIPGALELVEYMMAVLIPFSIAYCAFCKSHVAVEFILDRCPPKMQKMVDIAMTVLTILFLLLVALQSFLYAVEIYESKLTSSVLLIVTYPFVLPIAVGMVIFSLILIHELLPGILQRNKKEEK